MDFHLILVFILSNFRGKLLGVKVKRIELTHEFLVNSFLDTPNRLQDLGSERREKLPESLDNLLFLLNAGCRVRMRLRRSLNSFLAGVAYLLWIF